MISNTLFMKLKKMFHKYLFGDAFVAVNLWILDF